MAARLDASMAAIVRFPATSVFARAHLCDAEQTDRRDDQSHEHFDQAEAGDACAARPCA